MNEAATRAAIAFRDERENLGTVQKVERLIKSSADFVKGFTPPDYLIEGILQRRFVYSMTGMTGAGKTAVALLMSAHVALGWRIGDREVARGRVLYFAGENPDDIRMRWIAMADRMSFDINKIDVDFVPGVFSIKELHERIVREVNAVGGYVLIVVDTSAAYFEGADENDNKQMGAHARLLRSLTALKGGPAVLVLAHPVKNASSDNLLPRGGGAFVAEVDGNLTCTKDDAVTRLHWQGKFRGPDFDPIPFEIKEVTTPELKDSKGRLIPTVIAAVLGVHEEMEREEHARTDEDTLLLAMRDNPGAAFTQLLAATGWKHKSKISRTMKRLSKGRFVELRREHWHLTKLGKAEAEKAETPV